MIPRFARFVLLLIVLLLCSCAFGAGKQIPATEAVPATVTEPEKPARGATCWGIFASLGQSDTCGINGEPISVPGMAVACRAFSAGLVLMGRPPLDCGVSGEVRETDLSPSRAAHMGIG